MLGECELTTLGIRGSAAARPPERPLSGELPEPVALAVLLRDDVVEHGLIDVGSDGVEDQALELGGVERLDLPLHRLGGVEPLPAGEPGPARVAGLPRSGGQVVRADLVVREQHALHTGPAGRPGDPVPLDVGPRGVEVPDVSPGRRERAVQVHAAQKRSR